MIKVVRLVLVVGSQWGGEGGQQVRVVRVVKVVGMVMVDDEISHQCIDRQTYLGNLSKTF